MDILKENNDCLRLMDEQLHNHIMRAPAQYPEVSLTTEGESLILSRHDRSCHAEGEHDFASYMDSLFADVTPDTQYLVFMGTITEAVIHYIKNKLPNLNMLFVIEPTNQIFQYTLAGEKISDMIKACDNSKIYFFCNVPVAEYTGFICSIAKYSKHLVIVCSDAYEILFPDYYRELTERLTAEMRLQVLNTNTQIAFGKNFVKHSLQNYTLGAGNASIFKSFLRGKPAIIVGAGPSLKKNMHLLTELSDKAVIFAAGSSIPTLRQYGIKPHFHAAYEIANQSRFTGHPEFADIPLLFGGQTNPASLQSYPGEKFYMITDTDCLARHYFMPSEDEIVSSGPSIVNLVHDFVCKCGCSPVIFIGQDMCMYDNNLHSIDEKIIEGKAVEYTAEFFVADIYGRSVGTLTNYWIIKLMLENINARYPDIEFINATEGGIGIDGVANEQLADVLQKLPDRELSIRDSIRSISAAGSLNYIDYIHRLQELDFLNDIDTC